MKPEEITRANITNDLGRARRAAGLTQRELADAAEISQGYVSLLESKARALPLSIAVELVDILRDALEQRIETRARIKVAVDTVLPWTAEDARRLEQRRRRALESLRCE